jgi:ubiquinone/menaquinone biosynthesis C-methylase UbiE
MISAGKHIQVPLASSVTHQHLLSVLATELAPERTIRILDVGCGQGGMISFFHVALTAIVPDARIELYGFDQVGHGTQSGTDYRAEILSRLNREVPGVRWEDRIFMVRRGEPWPWDESFFDAAVSNQVLEHVHDLDDFFGEIHRVLKPGGISVHLFPLKNYVYEGHIFAPFAHRILDHDLAVKYLRLMHRLGFGKLDAHGTRTRHGFANAEMQADWFHRFTNYTTKKQLLSICRKHDLRTSFRYTREFYKAKLRQVLRRQPTSFYRRDRSVLFDKACFAFLKYISGITLFLQKPTYQEHEELLLIAKDQVDCAAVR